MTIQSRVFEVDDPAEAVEFCYQQGWTDGLPVIPPTEAKVAAVLDYLGRDPGELIGVIPPKNRIATLEKVAINSVMGGCLPQHVPVVLAAIEAMLEEGFNLNGIEATQHPSEPLAVVSGPVVKELGFNYGDGVFGGGSRANAAIGRAIRLVLWNIGGSIPGEIAKSPLSQPGRYCFCIAEDPDANPWEPIHVERGLPAEASAVTMIGCTPPIESFIGAPEGIYSASSMLTEIADLMATVGSNHLVYLAESLLVIGPAAARTLAQDGWTRHDIRRYLYEQARRPLSDLASVWYDPVEGNPRWPKWIDQSDMSTRVPIAATPDGIHLVVSGGVRSKAWCPGWHFTQAQTKAIRFPGGR